MTAEQKREYFKQYYLRNRERERQERREWYKLNREEILAKLRQQRALNPDKEREYKRKWRAANLEHARATQRKSRLKQFAQDPEKLRKRSRLWNRKLRLENPERACDNLNQWRRKRKAADPSYRIITNLRCRISKILKGKSASTMKHLGCSIDEFKLHLLRRFQLGMTMFNYGSVWHVDHVKPCANFDLSDPKQQAACFHFTNLQPLFGTQNLLKGAR